MVLPSRAPPAPGRGRPGRAVSHARHQRHRGAAGGRSRAGPRPGSHAPLHTGCCFHTRPDPLPSSLTRCLSWWDSPCVCPYMCALPCVHAQVCTHTHTHTPLPCECVTLPDMHTALPLCTHMHVDMCADVSSLPSLTHLSLVCLHARAGCTRVYVCVFLPHVHARVHTLLWRV